MGPWVEFDECKPLDVIAICDLPKHEPDYDCTSCLCLGLLKILKHLIEVLVGQTVCATCGHTTKIDSMGKQ